MKERLLIVADLGRLRAYRMEESRQFSRPHLELIEDSETGLAEHLSQELSDQAGRFRKSPGRSEGPSELSDGEQHNIDLERRRRAVKTLAQRIGALLQNEGVDSCYLAADGRINQPVLDEMQADSRSKIRKNITCNLSKLGPEELLEHFCE